MANLQTIAMLAELDGLVLVDKPLNLSSHDAVKAVKTHFNLVKVGHGGTLDPNATGLLVLLVGDGTKLSGDLMGGDRAYEAVIRLGRETNTGDREGAVVAEKSADGITREALDAALAELRGDVFQREPAFNVIKMPMHASYDVMPVDEKDRRRHLVHVYRNAVTAVDGPLVTLDFRCTKGTSVRAFAQDLGAALGCGASVETLRRVRCGKFSVDQALPLMDLLKLDAVDFKARVIPMAGALV